MMRVPLRLSAHSMQLTLAIPGLLAHPVEALATIGMLSHLAAIATPLAEIDLDSALIRTLGLDAATGPLAALGSGIDVGDRWVMRADPVTMTVGRDDVFLDARVDDLDDGEAATLREMLSRHFASDGLAFEARRPDACFVASARPFAIETTPVDAAIGRTMRMRLPAGPDAATWRRWFTETQMLLHDHPLSQRSLQPVNAVWFASGGTLPATSGIPALRVFAKEDRAADVARGIAFLNGGAPRAPAPLPEAMASSAGVEHLVVVLARVDPATGLDAVRGDLDAAWHALTRGTLESLMLVTDGAGVAASWRAMQPTWFQRLRRRSVRFALPQRET